MMIVKVIVKVKVININIIKITIRTIEIIPNITIIINKNNKINLININNNLI